MFLSVLGYLADAAIIGTFIALAFGKTSLRVYFWANAIGGIPLLFVEIATHAWPVMPLTITFTVVGWIGVIRGDRNNQGPEGDDQYMDVSNASEPTGLAS